MHHVQLILVIICRIRRIYSMYIMKCSLLMPIKPLGLIVYGQCVLGDNVLQSRVYEFVRYNHIIPISVISVIENFQEFKLHCDSYNEVTRSLTCSSVKKDIVLN